MAAPTYVAQGGAVTASTAVAPAYPAGIQAGDLLLMYLSTDGAIPTAQSGWTAVGAVFTGGGFSSLVWAKTAAGTESGTYTVSGITGGTKGYSWISAYRPSVAGRVLTAVAATAGADTDSTSTAYSAAGSSWTVGVDDLVVASTSVVTTGTFSASWTGPTVTQGGATVASTSRFYGRGFTNTVQFGHADATVNAGGTGVPGFTATTVGANGTGNTFFVRLFETAAPVTSAVADTIVSLGAWSKYGSAATTEAGIGDADAATGIISSTAANDLSVTAISANVAAGSRDIAITVTVPSGTGSIKTEIRAADGTTVLSPAQVKTNITSTAVDVTHTVTLASATAGMRLYAWANPS